MENSLKTRRSSVVCTDASISAEGINKRFGKVQALDNINLIVDPGIVFALLGPNGSGKTTLVRILATLLRPDSGTAHIAGYDVVHEAQLVRSVIGLAGQYPAVEEILTGKENLEMIGQLYHLGNEKAKARAIELLGNFELSDAANRRVKTYSRGMCRRLDLAATLVASPSILFLDEPTTGLIMEVHNQVTEKTNWTSYIVGCIAGVALWVAIAIYFFGSLAQAEGGVPTFVYIILPTLFVFFFSFAPNMVLQYKKVGPWRNYLFGERAYVVLSLVAKSALAWQVFAGTLRPV